MGLAAVRLNDSPVRVWHGRAEKAANGLPEAIDNLRLYGALSRALSLAEGRGQSHALRVEYLSVRLAEAAGLDTEEMNAVFYGALLHDLGAPLVASRLADYCLSSEQSVLAVMPTITLEEVSAAVTYGTETSALNDMAEHCAQGQAFAKELGFDDAVADTIYWHHEAWDGSGFPDGLREDEIRQSARIVAFADWVDTVVGNHVAHTRGRVGDWLLRLVSDRSGTKLDPDLTDVYESIADEIDPLLKLDPAGLIDEMCTIESDCGGQSPSVRWRQTLGGFVELVDNKSPYTVNHSRNVAAYAQTMATEMNLGQERSELVTLAGLVHDIGKLGVPSKIIDKKGALTEREWQTVRRHPRHSQEILADMAGLEAVAQIAGQHHEWIDGSGYPRGSTGDEISLEARVVAAADVFEGMTAQRPYRDAIAPDRALELMRHEMNHRFAPEILRVLTQVVRKYNLGRKIAGAEEEETRPSRQPVRVRRPA